MTAPWPRDNAELLDRLGKARQRWEQLVESMPDLVLLVGPDGRVAFTNRPAALPPGGSPFPAVGALALDFVAPSDRDALAAAMKEVCRQRRAVRDLVFRMGSGAAERIFEGALSPIVEDDAVAEIQLVGHDVTDRVRAAEALRKANETLTRRDAQMRYDLDVAARIHASLLPGPVQTGALLIDLQHVPLLGVGGDYVYVHDDASPRPAVGVFDVAGHGVAAALVASRVHSAVCAIAGEGLPPEEVIRRLNRFIYESFSDAGMFVTLLGLMLDLETMRAHYAGAGHPPALLQKGGGQEIIPLSSEHLPIGVATEAFLGAPFRTVPLDHGDIFWLYTDGLTECRRRDGQYLGINGLMERLRARPPAPPRIGLAQQALTELLSDLRAPQDDVTLVVVAVP